MYQTSDIQTVNSLTYADVAGLQLGLSRLSGEDTATYVDRLYRATVSKRDHSYEGILDELALELGLSQSVAGCVTGMGAPFCIGVAPGSVTVNAATIPTVILEEDHYLVWRTLGEVFADIDALPGVSAVLTAAPTLPALQLARQGNVFTVINEAVDSMVHACAHGGVIADSLRFTMPISGWQLTEDVLRLSSAAPRDLRVSYQYRVNPCDLVISDVGMFSVADPSLARVAVSTDNVLAYQVREVIQSVMKTDRSYWAK